MLRLYLQLHQQLRLHLHLRLHLRPHLHPRCGGAELRGGERVGELEAATISVTVSRLEDSSDEDNDDEEGEEEEEEEGGRSKRAVSEYERVREANIREREELWASMGLGEEVEAVRQDLPL